MGPEYKSLRIAAEDGDDLQVLSAALQDAVCKIGDMAYDAASRRFTLVVNRYLWETGRKGRGLRTRCAVDFAGVLDAKFSRLRLDAREAVVSLLSVNFEPGDPPGGWILLTFSGGGAIRLQVECIDALLADIAQPWPAARRPNHPDEA